MHGANRLGGNGVANSTVFGAVAGDAMAAWVKGAGYREPDRAAIDAAVAVLRSGLSRGSASANLESMREKLYDVMWEKVGIVRDAAGLLEAQADLQRAGSRSRQLCAARQRSAPST